MVRILLGCLLSYSAAHAQIVTIPIPGSPLSLNVMANPQPLQNIHTNPASTAYQLWDDGFANVPLGFDFPFFGKTFNNSTMYSNGAVQFGAPVNGWPENNTFCCNGITIDRNTPSAYNYSILMMQTDMYGASGKNHYSLGTKDTMTYGWYDVERLGDPTNKTSFELKIDSKGGIDMRWTGAVITMNSPAIGVIGDAAKGEFAVIQQGSVPGTFTIPSLSQWTTGQTPDIAIDQCLTNPLFSETCSGYQAAYLDQQCSINALYSTSCSGYQAAYTSQQCTINPLYDSSCSGYATAYKTQQCTANALYAKDCPGYEQAYLNAQCIIDSLYSNKCEGYATAYAIKYLVTNIDSVAVNSSLSNTAAIKANDPTNTVVATNTASTTIASDGTVSTAVSATGDTNVDKVIAPKPPSPSGNSPAAPVQLVAQPPSPTPPAPAPKQEAKSNDSKPAPTARQEMQAKREAAAKAKAVEDGKNLAENVGKAADMEQQKQIQNTIIQAMGYTPGFDAYSRAVLQDVVGYKPVSIYNNQKTIDNRSNLRMFSGTDALHNEMVNSQYKGK